MRFTHACNWENKCIFMRRRKIYNRISDYDCMFALWECTAQHWIIFTYSVYVYVLLWAFKHNQKLAGVRYYHKLTCYSVWNILNEHDNNWTRTHANKWQQFLPVYFAVCSYFMPSHVFNYVIVNPSQIVYIEPYQQLVSHHTLCVTCRSKGMRITFIHRLIEILFILAFYCNI